jgi:asparaginyl-tRNA synthetase
MKESGLEPGDYAWYLQIREYGGVKHSGFGLGFERLIMYLSGMENIRDVIPFPRVPNNADF